MVTVSDGKSKPVPMRLHLSMEVLKLQREDLEVKCLFSIGERVIYFLANIYVTLDRVNTTKRCTIDQRFTKCVHDKIHF